ncbi:MAG: hypothetical protein QXH32_02045 [Candidatus Caldarchaeum sp.]
MFGSGDMPCPVTYAGSRGDYGAGLGVGWIVQEGSKGSAEVLDGLSKGMATTTWGWSRG